MGKEDASHAAARNNVAAWTSEVEGAGLDAIVINASGCGTTVKDYGFMLKDDSIWAEKAGRIASLTKDVSEVMSALGVGETQLKDQPSVVYHSACSMQHGQKLREEPKNLLKSAGFEVRDPAEGHLCCGSAGTYNLLQPELAGALKVRKAAHLEAQGAAVIATGNIGCLIQISGATEIPVVHTVELLDWATGGPVPESLK